MAEVTRNEWTRRGVLRASAIMAGAVALAGCSESETPDAAGPTGKSALKGKGSVTKPLEPPSKLNEAPMLADLVKAGELDPVEKRLPEMPYVIPHKWAETGNYGGTMRLMLGADPQYPLAEYTYGHSIVRFLNDGLDVGPGLAESWESNEDASVWTFHFRKGLRWSDGQPWTTADIMYWWDDLVQNPDHPEVPPDDVRSGRDTIAEVTAPDDHTLTLTFDAPAPATLERMAAWCNRGNGPIWMQPKHYAQQFHPKYNKEIKTKDWATAHDEKCSWALVADCPTMTGWVCKSYKDSQSILHERNPYYWVVDQEGNQLPYIDTMDVTLVEDDKVQKLEVVNGEVDYLHGGHHALVLGDLKEIRDRKQDNQLNTLFWDSGSGSGTMVFWNQDYPDPKVRELINNKLFRQALSHAYNRKDVQKALYYNSGEVTTATLSPKGLIFAINDEANERYVEWRDSYVEYDPEKAKQILDDLGVVDSDGDGKRELPDGSKLEMSLDYPADVATEYVQNNQHVKRDWDAVGIATRLNPQPSESFIDQWIQSRYMTRADWEIGDNHPLVYPGWVIPVAPDHWAPMHGQAYGLQTADPAVLKDQADLDPWERSPRWIQPEPGSPIDKLYDLYTQARVEPDQMKRIQLLWEIVKIHVDEGPYLMGSVANYPRIVLVHADLRNVPARENLALGGWVNPWILPSPAVYDPETYYWNNPESHTSA